VDEPPANETEENLMGKLVVTAFTTLDNVMEDPHLWSGDYFSVEGTGAYNDAVLQPADVLLLGRVTYEGFAPAWSQRSGDPFSDKFNSMPKVVVSTTLETADWNNSTIVRDDVLEEVRRLKEDNDVLIWGSARLVQTLVEAGLVDEFELLVSPIVRGSGKQLLPPANFRTAEATALEGGMVAMRLVPAEA
jgi:dihydrofolate reductase